MVVGRVELPLTREQVVEMLFGDEYTLVPKKGAKAKPHAHVEKKSTGKRMGRPPSKCARCDGKVVKGKRLCKKHYALIIATQKKAVAAKKRGASKPRGKFSLGNGLARREALNGSTAH